jgi:hypothetical protein
MDFRLQATEATEHALARRAGMRLDELGESGCLELPAGRGWHVATELPTLAVLTVSAVCPAIGLPLLIMGFLPSVYFFPIMLASLDLMMIVRRIKSLILRTYLASRQDSLLAVFGGMSFQYVGLEDGETHTKMKIVIEDEGVCLLDADQERLLIEACAYRYVIYAKDILSVEPISSFGYSGSRIKCRMQGHPMDIVPSLSGHGPMSSLVDTISPATNARRFSRILNRTLFGVDDPEYWQVDFQDE